MNGTAGQIAPASERLPERQREALLLREREGLPYDEIAKRMGASRDSVAQLIAHAWINLYDELRGTALASVSPCPECERGLRLIAARDDGELEADSAEERWLEAHLQDCGRCQRAVEEMRAARAHFAQPASVDGTPGGPAPVSRRRLVTIAATATALLLLAGVTAAVVRDDPAATSVDRTAGSAQSPSDSKTRSRSGAAKRKTKADDRPRKRAAKDQAGAIRATAGEAPVEATTTVPTAAPVEGSTGGPTSRKAPTATKALPGKVAVEPPQQTASKPAAPRPTPAAPAPAPSPSTVPSETSPPKQAVPGRPGRSEPPGKPANRPPK